MKYLVTIKGSTPFLTKWFDIENNYMEGMIVYDLAKLEYTTDGENWNEIEIDHL